MAPLIYFTIWSKYAGLPYPLPMPPGPAPDPIARRVRDRRRALGLTLDRLAERATRHLERTRGGRHGASVSVSYLSLIENGRKVPDEPVALALAAALGEDAALFRAWIAARKSASLDTALEAARFLSRALAARGPEPGIARPERAAPRRGVAARLRVPVVPAGADPGDGVRPSCEVLGWRALDLDALPEDLRPRLRRPFAFRVGDAAARHCAPWPLAPAPEAAGPPRAGDHVVIARDFEPLAPGTLCAVRAGGGLSLRRVIWNGRALLLLPAPGDDDFEVFEAPDAARLCALVAGRAVRIEEADVG